ncbi:MAG: hypothetical protein R6W06_07950 [Prochlorococcaceae cyanobacterium]
MFFKRKESFFLDFSGGETKPAVQVAPVQEKAAAKQPAPEAKPASIAAVAGPSAQASARGAAPATASAAEPAAAPAAAGGEPVLTTAEAIAAELAAVQASRPAPSLSTFAPDCLNPANAVPSRRRRAGANLAGFKAMAASLIRS